MLCTDVMGNYSETFHSWENTTHIINALTYLGLWKTIINTFWAHDLVGNFHHKKQDNFEIQAISSAQKVSFR